jgi:hypothetical protein
LLRTSGRRRLAFPPCEGGVGHEASVSSMYSSVHHNDVRERQAIQRGETTDARSALSIDSDKYDFVVQSKLTGPPPLTPPSQGG